MSDLVKARSLPVEAAALHEPLIGESGSSQEGDPDRNGPRPKRYMRAKSAPAHTDAERCNVRTSLQVLPLRTKNLSSRTLVYAVLALLGYVAAGVLVFYRAANSLQGLRTGYLVDAIYFCIVTITTVGYGDITPATPVAKILTCVYLVGGFWLCSYLLGRAANYLVMKQEGFLLKAIYRKADASVQEQLRVDYPIQSAHWKVLTTTILVFTMLALGVVLFMIAEKKNTLDAFYAACVTMTTLGYGDHSFQTQTGRLIASAWIILSTLCVTQLLLSLVEMRTEEKQQHLANWVLTRKTTTADLEAADIDEDGKVRASDFVLYKLKELGKITEADIYKFIKEFRALDVDGSGILSASDLNRHGLGWQ